MADRRVVTIVVAATFVIAIGINYLFALAGHPGSLWLFRDILGIM